MDTTFYSVVLKAESGGLPIEIDIEGKGYDNRYLGQYECMGVFSERCYAEDAYKRLKDAVDSASGMADAVTMFLYESRDFGDDELEILEAKLGHGLDYYTQIGGEISFDDYICELLPFEFERGNSLLVNQLLWDSIVFNDFG